MNNVTMSPRTALVVEGCEFTREVLHDVLMEAGFDTMSVACGTAASTMLAGRHFDVLVADIYLPDMHGLAVCEAARERYQGQIAILVMSGHDIERWGLASLQLCADDFLGKPFDLDEFIARIESKLCRTPKSHGRAGIQPRAHQLVDHDRHRHIQVGVTA